MEKSILQVWLGGEDGQQERSSAGFCCEAGPVQASTNPAKPTEHRNKFLASSKPAENGVQGGLFEMKMPEVLPAPCLLLNTHLERAVSK